MKIKRQQPKWLHFNLDVEALIWWGFLGHKIPTSLRSRAKAPSGKLCSVWWALKPPLAKSSSAWREASHEGRESPQNLISWDQNLEQVPQSNYSHSLKRENRHQLCPSKGDTVQVYPGHFLKSLGCLCIWKIRKIAQWQTTDEEKDNHLA